DKAMEDYVQEALKQGFICPSTSPLAAGFFFMEKGGLRTRRQTCYSAYTKEKKGLRELRASSRNTAFWLRSGGLFKKNWRRPRAKILAQQNGPESWPKLPPGRQYVPTSLRGDLVRWAHTSWLSRKYWWGSLVEDMQDFVMSCLTCAQSLHWQTALFAHFKCPWSHHSMDFVTDLPVSEGNAVILVTVDQFSKMCRLIPFPSLPTVKETTDAIFTLRVRTFWVAGGSSVGPGFPICLSGLETILREAQHRCQRDSSGNIAQPTPTGPNTYHEQSMLTTPPCTRLHT
ncbi:hypothetical protein P4O66_007868, partial [Electrophorus voltai]